MSRHASQERVNSIIDPTEAMQIIKEEQCSPALSSDNVNATSNIIPKEETDPCKTCSCKEEILQNKIDAIEVTRMLKEKEEQMQEAFEKHMEKEIKGLKERFDFILQNEQVRSSYMLREAHRERQEKVTALQTQLECKNMAGLMYVMCTERRQSKLDKLRLIEEYTIYINALQDILGNAQSLILHLSRGYKTAARVDYEWRNKMVEVIKEFQAYVYHFAGGTLESNQYLFDLPALLQTKAPVVDDPEEDPCDELEDEEVKEAPENNENKPWWERLEEGEARPFVMFGDMAEFKPPQRRDVLKTVKAAKTAPKKWKEYVFNEMFLKAHCPNADSIKDEYSNHIAMPSRWECQAVQTQDSRQPSKISLASRRVTAQSMDIRGNMGSILKIITSPSQPTTKTALLGARDSMEIASTTRLREKHKNSEHSKVTINVGHRKTSFFEEPREEEFEDFNESPEPVANPLDDNDEDEEDEGSHSDLGGVHNDSTQVVQSHVPDHDHKINYEKVCPIDKCRRMHVDSFVKSLPAYMRASPFTHFEQTFEEYETCTSEQLQILKHRIAEKKKEQGDLNGPEENPLNEWTPSIEGVAVQTSAMSIDLPPCTCLVPSPTPVSSVGRVFNVEELIPMKQALDNINRQCFYDTSVEFNRFKVIGQESNQSMATESKRDYNKTRLQEITKILKQHPSLLGIFQANTRC